MDEVFGSDSSIIVELDETLRITSNSPEKTDLPPLAPLKQISKGIEAKDIQCKSSFELIFKYSGEPACVKASSVQKLVSWGWTQ